MEVLKRKQPKQSMLHGTTEQTFGILSHLAMYPCRNSLTSMIASNLPLPLCRLLAQSVLSVETMHKELWMTWLTSRYFQRTVSLEVSVFDDRCGLAYCFFVGTEKAREKVYSHSCQIPCVLYPQIMRRNNSDRDSF